MSNNRLLLLSICLMMALALVGAYVGMEPTWLGTDFEPGESFAHYVFNAEDYHWFWQIKLIDGNSILPNWTITMVDWTLPASLGMPLGIITFFYGFFTFQLTGVPWIVTAVLWIIPCMFIVGVLNLIKPGGSAG